MSRKKRDCKELNRERGQSLTELAVSFTLLVILLAVAVDGGRFFFSYIAVREASEEGVIYGVISPSDTAGIEARVRTSSVAPVDLTDTGNVTVSINVIGNPCVGNSMQVTVTYIFNLTMPFVGAILGTNQFPLTATSTGTILSPSC